MKFKLIKEIMCSTVVTIAKELNGSKFFMIPHSPSKGALDWPDSVYLVLLSDSQLVMSDSNSLCKKYRDTRSTGLSSELGSFQEKNIT